LIKRGESDARSANSPTVRSAPSRNARTRAPRRASKASFSLLFYLHAPQYSALGLSVNSTKKKTLFFVDVSLKKLRDSLCL
jgi:hypothetical protein